MPRRRLGAGFGVSHSDRRFMYLCGALSLLIGLFFGAHQVYILANFGYLLAGTCLFLGYSLRGHHPIAKKLAYLFMALTLGYFFILKYL